MPGGLRIIGGEWGGRRLKVPHRAVRPTRDRLRQILFDILVARGVAGSVLDLYAGSGALGLEALSRGAEHATFVESAAAAVGVLRDNVTSLGVSDRCRVFAQGVERTLPRLLEAGEVFDLILADPPYGTGDSAWLVAWVGDRGMSLLADGGRLVVETERDTALPEQRGGLRRIRRRPTGESDLHFYVVDRGQSGHEASQGSLE